MKVKFNVNYTIDGGWSVSKVALLEIPYINNIVQVFGLTPKQLKDIRNLIYLQIDNDNYDIESFSFSIDNCPFYSESVED